MELQDIQSGCEADLCQPLIAFLRAKKEGRSAPPFIPQWDLMPLHKLCQLALLWSRNGFEREAGQLAHWLSQFVQNGKPLLPLWCPEKEYNEKEGERLFSLLSAVEPIPSEPPDFGLTLIHSPAMTSAFTLAGNGTSLGMIRTADVEIRALGPQTETLNFGIKGRGMNGWTRCFALPEVWLEVKTACKERECQLDLRFVGLKPETPLYFAFYVKAPSCQVGNEVLKPKSLRRFNGEASTVIFQKLKIESTQHKVQVIPLAGEGCFWDTDFLVTFEMHPFEPQAKFLIFA